MQMRQKSDNPAKEVLFPLQEAVNCANIEASAGHIFQKPE